MFLRRHLTRNVVIVSVVIHLSFLVAAGSIVAMRIFYKPQSVFVAEEAPRPALEPRKLEMKVRVQDMQKRSSRPRPQPRIMAMRPADVALPEIRRIPDPAQAPLKRVFSTHGISGRGSGIGGGLGDGAGDGLGASTVSFFGIKDKGHRIVIIVDVSESMCEDQRGGLTGYQRVKAALEDVVYQLQDGSFFNVVAFAEGVSACWEKMKVASPDTRNEAADWVLRYNRLEGPYGLSSGNYGAGAYGLDAEGGSSRLDLALTAAFEMGADTIFVITDGIPEINKPFDPASGEYAEVHDGGHQVTDAEMRAWEKAMEDWEKEQEKRRRKGLGPRLTEGGGGPPGRPANRQGGRYRRAVVQKWTTNDILEHIEKLQQQFYLAKGKQQAHIHCVGYEPDRDTRKFLRELARKNRGRYRKVRGLG